MRAVVDQILSSCMLLFHTLLSCEHVFVADAMHNNINYSVVLRGQSLEHSSLCECFLVGVCVC